MLLMSQNKQDLESYTMTRKPLHWEILKLLLLNLFFFFLVQQEMMCDSCNQ